MDPSSLSPQQIQRRREELELRIRQDASDRFYSGIGASTVATVALQPIFRIKAIQQCLPEYSLDNKNYNVTNVLNWKNGIAANIRRLNGFRGYWHATGPALAFTTPVVTARIVSTLYLAQNIDNRPDITESFLRGFAVTGIMGMIATLCNPFAIAHNKMSSDFFPPKNVTSDPKRSPYQFRNMIFTLKRVYLLNGLPRTMFHGSLPFFFAQVTHFGALAAAALTLSQFELPGRIPALSSLAMGIFACCLAHPFDTIRTRMHFRMPTSVDYSVRPYSSTMDCISYIWRHEGVRGFTRGMGSNIALHFGTLLAVASIQSAINSTRHEQLRRDYIATVKDDITSQRLSMIEQNLQNEQRIPQ